MGLEKYPEGTRTVSLLAAVALLSPFTGALAQARLPSTACRVEGLEQDVRCVTVDVPETRATAGGRTIPLRVVVLPANAPAGGARQAVFYLVGGPGLAATPLADLVAQSHAATRSTHDIVLVDQRGTGGSNALDCALYGSAGDMGTYLADQFPVEPVRECAQRLRSRADLTQYTTANAADDLDAVRAHLGVDRIDLDASAYGTRVALEYLRRYPARVRSVVLQGVVPDDVSLPLTAAGDAQRALDQVFAGCAVDPFCRTSFPLLRRELSTLLARLDSGALSVRVQHPRSADSVTVRMTRGVFVDRLRLMLYSTGLSRRIPIVLHRAHEGEWTPFVTVAYELSRVVFDQLDAGAHLSAMCTDDMSGTPEGRDTFLGDHRATMYRRACAVWPHPNPPRPKPVTTPAPVLLVTGALDPVTPPRFAERVARSMPNATMLIVPGMAHAGAPRCVEAVISAFISRGSMQGVDSSCIAEVKAPTFITR